MGYATLRPGYTLHVDAWVASQNQAGNYSTIAWRRYVKKNSSTWYRGQWAANTERVWSNLAQIRETSGWWYDFLNNTIQLDVSGTFRLNHDSNGYASYEVASYVNIVQIGSATAYSGRKQAPRISVAPKAPGKPVVTELKPTSLFLTWPAPTDMGGADLDHYLVQYWPNAEGTGTPLEVQKTTRSGGIANLIPGTTYRIEVHAKNKATTAYSPASPAVTAFTQSRARVRFGGVWRLAIPYVRVAGQWKMASPFIRSGGTWKRAS